MISPWVAILALIGLADALWILSRKLTGRKLHCILGDDCDRVVRSKYGSLLFRIPNEAIGALFYLGLLGAVLWEAFAGPVLLGTELLLLLRVAAVLSAILSLFLLAIQALALKEWCEWCLVAIVVNILIALLVWGLP